MHDSTRRPTRDELAELARNVEEVEDEDRWIRENMGADPVRGQIAELLMQTDDEGNHVGWTAAEIADEVGIETFRVQRWIDSLRDGTKIGKRGRVASGPGEKMKIVSLRTVKGEPPVFKLPDTIEERIAYDIWQFLRLHSALDTVVTVSSPDDVPAWSDRLMQDIYIQAGRLMQDIDRYRLDYEAQLESRLSAVG